MVIWHNNTVGIVTLFLVSPWIYCGRYLISSVEIPMSDNFYSCEWKHASLSHHGLFFKNSCRITTIHIILLFYSRRTFTYQKLVNTSKYFSPFISICKIQTILYKVNTNTKGTNIVCHIHKDIGMYCLFVCICHFIKDKQYFR